MHTSPASVYPKRCRGGKTRDDEAAGGLRGSNGKGLHMNNECSLYVLHARPPISLFYPPAPSQSTPAVPSHTGTKERSGRSDPGLTAAPPTFWHAAWSATPTQTFCTGCNSDAEACRASHRRSRLCCCQKKTGPSVLVYAN